MALDPKTIQAYKHPKIRYLSDLHFEHEFELDLIVPDDEILVLAGDIHSGTKGIEWAAKQAKNVIYVAGNHEFYGLDYSATLEQMRETADKLGVNFLENNSVVIDNIRFIGGTLWTNLCGFNPNMVATTARQMNDLFSISAQSLMANPEFMAECEKFLTDQGLEHLMPKEKEEFTPFIPWVLHNRTVNFISDEIARDDWVGHTVVVSHHAPSFKALEAFGVDKRYLNSRVWDHCRGKESDDVRRVVHYASDLDADLNRWSQHVDLWIHGHLHKSLSYAVNGIACVTNPRGYPYKPLTKKEADATRFWHGISFTDKDIARSQRLKKNKPWHGDNWDFSKDAVIDNLSLMMPTIVRKGMDFFIPDLKKLATEASKAVKYLDYTDPEVVKLASFKIEQTYSEFVKKVSEAIIDLSDNVDSGYLSYSDKLEAKAFNTYSRPLGIHSNDFFENFCFNEYVSFNRIFEGENQHYDKPKPYGAKLVRQMKSAISDLQNKTVSFALAYSLYNTWRAKHGEFHQGYWVGRNKDEDLDELVKALISGKP